MNNEKENLAAARKLVRQITGESCNVYNLLCGTDGEETVMNVLEGQLRMASKLAELQNKIGK